MLFFVSIPSSPGPLFQNEGRCSAFDMEIIFHSQANKTHFHKKGCAPSLILNWKWGFLEIGIGLYEMKFLTSFVAKTVEMIAFPRCEIVLHVQMSDMFS